MVNKYIKDGEVGILYSPGFGAGWSSWGEDVLCYDYDLVKAFLEGGIPAIKAVAAEKYPDMYQGGLNDIEIEWIAVGTAFRINEYDGKESIEYLDPTIFMIA